MPAWTSGPAALEQYTRRMLEAWNSGRLEVVDELISPAYRTRFAYLGEVRGPEGVKRVLTMYRDAFPDLRVDVDDLFVHEDKVVSRWTARGTHCGELIGLAPTERHAVITGMTIDRWQEGRCVESWSESDQLSLLQQIGAVPAPGTFGDRAGKSLQRLTVRTARLRRAARPACASASGAAGP